jgi:ribonuclease D
MMNSKAKPTPSPSTRIAPMQSRVEQKRQEKALRELMKMREMEARRTGIRPNYYTN